MDFNELDGHCKKPVVVPTVIKNSIRERQLIESIRIVKKGIIG